jgi:hypothetical protein
MILKREPNLFAEILVLYSPCKKKGIEKCKEFNGTERAPYPNYLEVVWVGGLNTQLFIRAHSLHAFLDSVFLSLLP